MMRDHGQTRNLIFAHWAAAWVWLFIAAVAGMVMGAQLAGWPIAEGAQLFSPGRCWTAHTSFLLWGFLGNLAIGLMHDFVPHATGQGEFSRKLAWFVFAVLQAVVAAAGVGIFAGYAGEVPWGDVPSFILPMLLATLALTAINFGAPIILSDRAFPIATWFFCAAGAGVFFTTEVVTLFPDASDHVAMKLVVFCIVPAIVGIVLWIAPQSDDWSRRWLWLAGIATMLLLLQAVIQTAMYPTPLDWQQWFARNAYIIFFGVMPLWITAAMLSIVPRILEMQWKSPPLLKVHFWLTALALALFFTDLLPPGTIPGGGQPSLRWTPLATGAKVFWTVQIAAGIVALAGQAALIVNFFKTWRIARAGHVA